MPCFYPLTGYYSKEVNARTGKRGIVFNHSAAHSGVKLKLPCGRCIGCRLEHSRQWAMRCMHEKQMHSSNIFLTLTYDDSHLPHDGTLVKRDLVLFFKRLRKKYGKGVRFYACGEYGERTGRPHYHAIIFNIVVADKKFYKNAKGGQKLWTSATFSKLWPFGYNVIGDVDFDSCAYVARYIMKKVTGDKAVNYYSWVDEWGEIHSIQPEFVNMSRRPGIGKSWFDKYGPHSYEWDKVICNGKPVNPPRYYDGKFEIIDSRRLAELKVRRRRAIEIRETRLDRLRVREKVAKAALAQKGRSL